MEEELTQVLNGTKFQWNLNATEFIPLSFVQPMELSYVPEDIVIQEKDKLSKKRRKKVQKQEQKIQNNPLSELTEVLDGKNNEGRRRRKKEQTIKQEEIQVKPKRNKARTLKNTKNKIHNEEVKGTLTESEPTFIENTNIPTFSYKAAILTSQRINSGIKPAIEETVSSLDIPSAQTEKHSFSLPNRISKVSDNVIEKNKQRWIEISDQIIKQEKSTELNTPQAIETRQNHIWHDILRTGLAAVTNDQLATHSSSTALNSTNTHRVSTSGSSSYSHNIIIVPSVSALSSSSVSSGLSKSVVDQLLAQLSWWQIILYGAKDLILPALNLNSSIWQTIFRSSKLKKEEIEIIPAFLLELCEGVTCLHILCLLSPQHHQHISIDPTTLALIGKDRLFRFNDCLDLLLQSSFAIQDAINLSDNTEKKAPLHYLCQFNTPDCLSVITSPAIRPSLQVNAKDKDGNTPLHLLLIHQNYSLLPAFLAISPRKVSAIVGMVGNRSGGSGSKDLALKINQRNKEGAPPILYCNHRTSLQLLLKYGATPFLCDNQGYDCIHRMIERSEYGLVKTLLHFNYTPRQLQTSPFYQQQQHQQATQNSSAPNNTPNSSSSSSMSTISSTIFSEGWGGKGSGTTPFHLAIESGNAKILNLLFQSIDLSQTNCYFYDYLVFYLNRQDETYGLTAIQYAAMKGNAQAFFAFFFHPLCDIGRTILSTHTTNTNGHDGLLFSLSKLQNEIGLLCYSKCYDILIRVVRLVKQYYFYDLYLLRAQQEEDEYDEEGEAEGEMEKKKLNKTKTEKNDRFAQRRRSMLLLSQASIASSTSSYLLILQKLIASEEKGEKSDIIDDTEEVEKVVLMMPKRNYLALFTLASSTLACDPFVSCNPLSRSNLLNQVTDVLCQTILQDRSSRYYLPPPSTRLQREGPLISADSFIEKLRKVSSMYEDYGKGFLAMVLGGVSMSYDFIRFFLLTGNIISDHDDDVRLDRIVTINKNDDDNEINDVVIKEDLMRYEEAIKGRLLTWKLFQRYGLMDEDTSIINDFSFFYGNNPIKKNSNNNNRIEENKKEKGKEINNEEGFDYWSNDWKFIHLFPKVKLPLIIHPLHKQYTNNTSPLPFLSPSPLSTVRFLLAEGEEVTLPLHLLLSQSIKVQHIYHRHLTSNPLNSNSILIHLPHYTKDTLTFLLPYLQYRENVFFKKLRTISNLDEEQVRHVIYLLGNILQFSKELLINELELMTFHFIINAFFQYSIIFDDIRARQSVLIYAKTNDIIQLQDQWLELLQFLCNEEERDQIDVGGIEMKSGYYSFNCEDETFHVIDGSSGNNVSYEFFWFSYQDILQLFRRVQNAQKSQTPFIHQKINIIQTDNCLTNWINFIEDPNLLNIKSDYIHWDVTILPKSLSSDHNYFRMNIIIQSLSYHHLLEDIPHINSPATVTLPANHQALYSLLQGGECDRLQRWLKMYKSTLDAESRLKSRQKLASFCKYLYEPSSETIQEQFGVVTDSQYKSWINVTKTKEDGLDKNVVTLPSNHSHYYYVTNPQSVSLFPISYTSSSLASETTTPTTSFTASSLVLEMVTNIRHFLIDMTFLTRSYHHGRRQTVDLLLILHPDSDHKESKIYEVHKEIMFRHSEKIQAMTSFQSDQQERNQNILTKTSYTSSSIIPSVCVTVLSIEENVKEEVMSAAIYYCYHNFLPLHLFKEEEDQGEEDDVTLLLDLAIFASDYLMPSLLNHVTLLLLRRMNNRNSSDIYQTARHYHLYELEKVSALYLLKLYSLSLIPIAQIIQIQEDYDVDEEGVTEGDLSRKDGLKKKKNKEEKIYNYLLTTMMSSIFSY